MSKGGKYAKKKVRAGGRGWKIVLTVLGVVLALGVGAGVAVALYFDGMVSEVNHVEVAKIEYTKPPVETKAPEATQVGKETQGAETTEPTEAVTSEDFINFLVVGQQARKGEEARLADTMILCTLNTKTKTLTMTSILRDTLIKMPDYRGHIGGKIKLNTIYNLGYLYGDGIAGSMELMNMTLYDSFGIEVDHNFEIDFEVFVKVVEILGGVKIDLSEAEARHLNVKPGVQMMDGELALSYVRTRHADGDGGSDINRTSRQRKLIEAIIAEVRTRNIADLQTLVEEVLPLVATSMSKDEIKDTLLMLLPMLPELKLETAGACPQEYKGGFLDIYNDGVEHSVLYYDKEETVKAMRAITEGETYPESES